MSQATNTRTRILDAAENLFAQKGYAAASLTEIAQEVGIKSPAIYKHFKNKMDVYESVLERLFQPMQKFIDALEPGDTPEVYTSQMNEVLRYHINNSSIAKLIQHATLAGDETLTILSERWYKPFFDPVSKIAEAPDKHWLNPSVVMTFHSFIMGYITLAPLHAQMFGFDPLSEEQVKAFSELQESFLAGLEFWNATTSQSTAAVRL